MAIGNMGGAGGSWSNSGAGGSWANEDEEKKRKERLRNTNGVLGMSGLGQIGNEAAARNQAQQEVRTPYNSTPESRASSAKQLTGLGINPINPYVKGVPKPATGNMGGRGVRSANTYGGGDTSDLENPIMNEMSRGNSGKGFGLSVDNNAAVAQPLAPAMGGVNSGRGFGVMGAPRKAYGEDSRRAAIMMDIKPYQGMGGRLTTGQIALKDSIRKGDDEKYANEQYTTQINAAQKLAQEGMTQGGANSRAQLTESGANSRATQQLGFDAEKFQQVAELDKRKLDMQQSNDQVANYGTKKLNEFRDAWFNAESPEEKSAIEAQMAILTPNKDDKEYWTAIGGGETVPEGALSAVKNPDVLLNRSTGEIRQQPAAEIDFENDPRAQAIINNTALSKEEVRKQLEALR